ncbi:Mov34/MPN/PAD-1 family protein [Leptolyngbya sp. FACHB-16]|uniref:Mov34/MPN/PAD-1 family protein n=1 Tax=unclassified Leptolyngbya TaxID=2650499 RepID=UPI0016874EDE|nr:Mov34/MPN/PAD-1 family protein [Leptolyngbya sp. FACHB-16]MBD2156728.1 Mov34/MPN/PAD-1 family protein [Leptolyngbya sp. FACHB-16]
MQIHLPEIIAQKLTKALKRAGSKEIGGILMGEHISAEVYRIVDLTIQPQIGTTTSFLRLPLSVLRPLQAFFKKTSNQFTRFNYLGEWHSHPSYSVEPSNTDCEAMWEIVSDPSVGANFAILLVVKLNGNDQLEGGVTIFLPNRQMLKADLIQTSTAESL